MKELTEIQNELKAPKSQYNSFGKYSYRNCEDILEALKPLLKKNKVSLTLSDEIKEIGGIIYVEAVATLTNEKGSEAVSKAQAGINPNRKGMDIAQSFGSSSSYARKYCLSALFLLDDSQQIDSKDNTEENTKPKFTETAKNGCLLKAVDPKKVADYYDITPAQLKKYAEMLEEKKGGKSC